MEYCKGKRTSTGADLTKGGVSMAVYGEKFPKRSDMDCFKLYHGTGRNTAADLPPDICKKETPESETESPNDKNTKRHLFDSLIDEFLDGGIDSDKLLIAALLYMLIKEGADIKLIIALGYILM